MIYFIVFIYLLFCVILYDVYEKKQYVRFHYIVLFLFFTLIAGLRWRLGVDTVNYMNSFNYEMVPLSQLSVQYILDSQFQPFWVLLNSFCKNYNSFILLQILVSILLHISIFNFLYRSCTKPFTTLTIYYLYNYFYFSMEIMRESLAISCLLFGITCLNNRNYFKYYIWSICAFMFHFFAIFLFFIPLLLSERHSLITKISTAISLLTIWFIFKIQLLTFIVNISPPFISNKLIAYFFIDRYSSNLWRITGFVYNLLPLLIIAVYFYLHFGKRCKSIFKIKESLWSSCILLYSMLLILSTNMPILSRFSNYMYLIVAILYASCLYVIRFKRTSQVIFISIFFFLILGIRIYILARPNRIFADYKLHIHQYAEFYPYTSVFDKKEPLERTTLHSYWGDSK